MRPATLLLVRHGLTAANADGGARLSGWTDVPLSATGVEQARRLARRLAAEPPAAALWSSPLARARVTAEIIAGPLLPRLGVHPGLREIHCGEVDGLPAEEVRRDLPELWAANQRQDDEGFRWPGGESYRELRQRCLAALGAIAAGHPGERVLVVTHAGVISQILGAIQGTSAARWEDHRPGNASLTEIEWAEGRGRVLRFDDRSHLAELAGADLTTASRHPPAG